MRRIFNAFLSVIIAVFALGVILSIPLVLALSTFLFFVYMIYLYIDEENEKDIEQMR